MRSRMQRIVVVLALLAGGGTVMASSTMGCASFAGESLMTSLDLCFIFDCTNGIFGGMVQPCQQGVDVNGDPTGTLFLDCPDVAGAP